MGPDLDAFTAGAAWEDLRLGLQYLRLFQRCAVVTEIQWIRDATRFMAPLVPCPVKTFAQAKWDEAVAWLDSPVPPSQLGHRLLTDVGVLLVEPHGPLRAEDFEDISLTVDPWIEAHGTLHGVVVHAPYFPGWEDFEAFLAHLRFLRDHHRKVQRVALAADGRLARLGPRLADHFVQAEVKHFDHAQLEEALAWASAR